MADQPNSALEILIKWINDDEKAKQALAELEQFQRTTKTAGQSTEEAAEHSKMFNFHGREMHKIVHELNGIVPGLGHILKAVFNPEVIGITAAIMALELFKSIFEENKKKAEDFVKIWEAQHEAIEAAKEKIVEFNEEIGKGRSVLEQLQHGFDVVNSKIGAELEGQKQILEILEKQALAKVAGNKEEEQRIQRMFDATKKSLDLRAEEQRLNDLAIEKRKVEQNQSGLDDAFMAAVNARAKYVYDNAQGQSDAKNLVDKFKTEFGSEKTNEEKIRELEGFIKNANPAEEGFTIRKAQDELENRRKYAAAQKAIDEYNSHLQQLDRTVTEQDTAAKANIAALKQITNQYEQLIEVYRVHRQTEETTRGMTGQSPIGGPGTPRTPTSDLDIENRSRSAFGMLMQYDDLLIHGGHLNNAQQQTLQALANMIYGHVASQKEITALIQSLWANQKAQNEAFAKLRADIEALAHRNDRTGY